MSPTHKFLLYIRDLSRAETHWNLKELKVPRASRERFQSQIFPQAQDVHHWYNRISLCRCTNLMRFFMQTLYDFSEF